MWKPAAVLRWWRICSWSVVSSSSSLLRQTLRCLWSARPPGTSSADAHFIFCFLRRLLSTPGAVSSPLWFMLIFILQNEASRLRTVSSKHVFTWELKRLERLILCLLLLQIEKGCSLKATSVVPLLLSKEGGLHCQSNRLPRCKHICSHDPKCPLKCTWPAELSLLCWIICLPLLLLFVVVYHRAPFSVLSSSLSIYCLLAQLYPDTFFFSMLSGRLHRTTHET